jgi:2-haloacid dehalogenase
MTAHKIYVFDAYGTLFDVNSAVARWRDAVGAQADRLAEIWRAKQLEYTWVRSLMGDHRDFQAITRDALRFAAQRIGGLPAPTQAGLLDAYRELDAFADVRPKLLALKAAGLQIAILSNGTRTMLETACAAAGLTPLIDAILSVDEVGVFKTDPRVYAMVGARFDCARREVSFQSSNRWDVAGASRHGFRSVWINRSSQPEEYDDLPPAMTIRSLADLPVD